MLSIFLGLIISISIIVRSFEGFVTNKKVLYKVELIHKRAKRYTVRILKSNFKTASEGILLSSFKYLIYFCLGLFFLSTMIFGLSEKIGQVDLIFISEQLKAILVALFLFIAVKFGLKYNFKKFVILLKNDLLEILKSYTTWSVFLSVYVIIGVVLLLFVKIAEKKSGISKEDILNQVINNNSNYEIGISLGFPIIVLFVAIAGLAIVYLTVWLLSRVMSYISYRLLKKVFSICFCLNKNKPLKPILILLQVLIIVLTPCISFAFKIFNN